MKLVGGSWIWKKQRGVGIKWMSVKRGSTVLLNSPDKHHPKNLPSLNSVLPIGNTSVKGSPQNLYLVYVALHHFIQRLGYWAKNCKMDAFDLTLQNLTLRLVIYQDCMRLLVRLDSLSLFNCLIVVGDFMHFKTSFVSLTLFLHF